MSSLKVRAESALSGRPGVLGVRVGIEPETGQKAILVDFDGQHLPEVPARFDDVLVVATSPQAQRPSGVDFGASGGSAILAEAALLRAKETFSSTPGVVGMRLGYSETGARAVVISFDPSQPLPEVPARVHGYPVVLEARS